MIFSKRKKSKVVSFAGYGTSIRNEKKYTVHKQQGEDFKVFDVVREKNRRFSSKEIERDVQKTLNVVRSERLKKG